MDFMEWVIVLAITSIIGLVCYGAYLDASSPHMSLIKHEWTCTKDRQEMYLMPVGKTLMPMYRTVCLEYTKAE